MKDLICDEFQDTVSNCLVRHRSIIDVLTKIQETSARVNRAVAKSVTGCGCLEINAKKQQIPGKIKLQELSSYMDTHLKGKLCPSCREVLEQELGNHLFYIAALCNLLDLNIYDILLTETEKLSTLGLYNMS
ncbi:MAG: hypothetical protein PWR06_900 [Thermoanaerobacteraceae bacterium]|uniref:DUF1573 domain-containing protein n=1 Tax=Biomaibacter acetigenes TaxID=2316383 RepID=A0A3G2RB04_9FIRM|nr:DUF1573 domain-containing protein [Biomaibacter acetigenes]MDK2878184.1 hypothetical protein [Thermoanaerobacteraceae bacterium]RKL63723.1 DUF1573 domain-containing protein [Thermoanaerobacteraceae bacterium SP2]AYO31917.1 DUF1573 domain-containing protein [Biomaibacter acetigenes]MDN5300848.1 hypothetical protein [Thermoanaerobacteraceae bacterium]MDN5311673.1 hypothetical protein [Thermoanaerobacteraceae bacterium]